MVLEEGIEPPRPEDDGFTARCDQPAVASPADAMSLFSSQSPGTRMWCGHTENDEGIE